ncbi:hypothetical protein FO519_008520 [Halicephalobus sp. NKZ332]|nr:hypothetical protein FO519_008520 [Halicephalobus sp. NKZ332]
MFFKALVFAQLLLLGYGQSPTCTSDEISGMNTCWMSYFGNFGYTSIPDFHDYMNKYVGYLNAQGPKGLASVCTWIKQKDSCEAPYKADCMNPTGYSQIFKDDTQGDSYYTAEAINVWECGTGYNLTLDHFYCKLSVHLQHADELRACETTFFNEINQGLNCTYATEFVNCMQKIYLKYCGAASARFACAFSEVAMEVNLPMCNSSLPDCGTSKFKKFFLGQ